MTPGTEGDPTLADATAPCPACLVILVAPDESILRHQEDHLIWAHGASPAYLEARRSDNG